MQTRSEDFAGTPKNRQVLDRTAIGLLLHDAGMSKIPAFILDKTQNITQEERQKILKHPMLGIEMLSKLDLKFPEVEHCMLHHHERLNGSGYPQKLSGEAIPETGLLCAVVDSYCAMITDRPYAKAMDPKAAAGALGTDARYDSRVSKQLVNYLLNARLM